MANSRFVKYNNNAALRPTSTATYPRIINGNPAYSGAPDLVETSDGPMSNVLTEDRYAPWIGPAGGVNYAGSDTVLEVDLGSLKTIVATGIMGYRAASGASFPMSCYVGYNPLTTYDPNGYTEGIGTLPLLAARDFFSDISAAPIRARYWRFRFQWTNLSPGWSLGRILLATTLTDFGLIYTSGRRTLLKPRSVVEGYGRIPTITRTGLDNSYILSLGFQNVESAVYQAALDLMKQTHPIAYLAHDSTYYEVVPAENEDDIEHIWTPPDLYSFALNLRSLP